MKGLTFTAIFEAQSANYGEGFGNIAPLKNITRADGKVYSYISRQALRYSLIDALGWNNTEVEATGSGDKKAVQFHPEAQIDQYPEIDFFGYMKTVKKKGAVTRSAVCRLSHAISLEPYNSDLDFLTNMGLSKRNNLENSIAQSENHKSFYAYTVTIDLDRVGVDKPGEEVIQISKEEKLNRTNLLLDGFKMLYRDIKGRRENMTPLFIIGGVYDWKNPLFEGRIKLHKGEIQSEPIQSAFQLDEAIQANTIVGLTEGIFNETEAFKEMLKNQKVETVSVGGAFNTLKKQVEAYYEAH